MARSYEQRTLHFALPFVPSDLEIKLHVGGQRHLLQRHTTATLSAARQVNRALRLLPEDQVTHFVPDLQLPADQAQLLLVSFPLPLRPIPPIQRLPILLLVKLHVPQNAVRTVLERKRANGTISRFPHPALLAAGAQDDGTDPELAVDVEDFTDFLDAAAACVFQHGELCNIGGVSAYTVKSHILQSRGISDLAIQIQQQLKNYLSGKGPNWVEEVPYSNPDGTPSSKSRYVWSQTTQQWMVAPMQDGLRKVKNDPDLQSSATNAGNYVVLNGITAVGSPESGDAPPRLRGVNLAGDDGPDLRQHEIRQPAHGRLVAGRCAFVEPAFYPSAFPCRTEKSGKKVAAASNKLAISPRYTKNRLLRQGKDLPC